MEKFQPPEEANNGAREILGVTPTVELVEGLDSMRKIFFVTDQGVEIEATVTFDNGKVIGDPSVTGAAAPEDVLLHKDHMRQVAKIMFGKNSRDEVLPNSNGFDEDFDWDRWKREKAEDAAIQERRFGGTSG